MNHDPSHTQQPFLDENHRLLLLTGLLLGFALRLVRLGAESLWYDETVSVVLARKSIPALIAHTAGDIHPPGYYLLLHAWQAITHPTLAHGLEFLFAWPSLWFGLLILPLIYALGRCLLDRRVALIAVWIGAVHPFHLWYSQEVRMYTLGAVLGLLALWSLIKAWERAEWDQPVWPWLVGYAIWAALGMYVLYYFLFLLVALNVMALLFMLGVGQPAGSRTRPERGRMWPWLAAQGIALLLWLPWLPTFLHQSFDPPVPPWRVPWQTGAEFVHTVVEVLAAQIIGQTPPGLVLWPYALASVGLAAACYGYAKQRGKLNHAYLITLYSFLPLVLIFALTLLATPLYHVRYAFTYAPPMLLILAAGVAWLMDGQKGDLGGGRSHQGVRIPRGTDVGAGRELAHSNLPGSLTLPGRLSRAKHDDLAGLPEQILGSTRRVTDPARARLGGVTLAALLIVSGLGLAQFWTTPLYRADDHRGAVAALAAQWRPGDVILVNAGWAYTVLETYWPAALTGPESALPPLLGPMARLGQPAGGEGVAVVRSGSVDGGPSLGWGSSDSDFFPISQAETENALARVADDYQRIWHFRLYDTVSDPTGVVRDWLADHGEMVLDQPVPGRDFGRVQLFDMGGSGQSYGRSFPDDPESAQRVQAGENLLLLGVDLPAQIGAGETLYVPTQWRVLPGLAQVAGDLSASLRVYDEVGHLLAQHDGGFLPPTGSWTAHSRQTETFSLPIPVALPPGDYTISLLLYAQIEGQPIKFIFDQKTLTEMPLGKLRVQSPMRPVEVSAALVHFDYIDLVEAWPARTEQAAAEPLDVRLIWQPGPSAYRDTYVVTMGLVDEEGNVAAHWQDALGGWGYPSGEWPTGVPVLDWKRVALDPPPGPGLYTLTLGVSRAADGQVVPGRTGWWPWAGAETVEIGSVRLR